MGVSDFTTIIQGPQSASSVSAANAYRYLQFGKVIVSHWAGDDVSGFDGLPVKMVSQPKPPTDSCYNGQNIYYQCMSTLGGLAVADTAFCIKVRSDEAYTDLSPIIEKLVAAPMKFITCNVYFRRDREYKFHPSDHVIAGGTDVLIKTFSSLKTVLETYDPLITSTWAAEQRIFGCFLRANGVKMEPSKSKEIMRTWCDVVPISLMGSFIWTSYKVSNKVNNPHYIMSIDDI